MKGFILVLLACVAFTGATLQGQGGDDLVKKSVAAWQKTRDSTHTVECEITITTTEIARKSTISNRVLYPADITTTMKASARFDLDSGDFSVRLDGEKYDTAKQSRVPYSDQTVYFGKKLYGLLVPPKGKATGVGNGSGSGSDLAIVAGDLKSYPLPPDVSPILMPFGVIPLVPSQNLHPENWNTLCLTKCADLLFESKVASTIMSREVHDNPMDVHFLLGMDNRLLQRSVTSRDKRVNSIEFKYGTARDGGSVVTGWVREFFESGKLITRKSVVVDSLRINHAQGKEIQPPTPSPGMIVAKIGETGDSDRGSGSRTERFQVSDTGDLVQLERPDPDKTKPRWSLRSLGSILCLVFLSAVLGLKLRHWLVQKAIAPKEIV